MNTRRSMAFALAAGLAALAGVARAEAARAPDPAMAAVLDYVQGQRTTGFLVIQDRRPLVERNWPPPADARPAFRATACTWARRARGSITR